MRNGLGREAMGSGMGLSCEMGEGPERGGFSRDVESGS